MQYIANLEASSGQYQAQKTSLGEDELPSTVFIIISEKEAGIYNGFRFQVAKI